jgi:hypothetical protein
MQALQQQHLTNNIDEMIAVVKNVYHDFPLNACKKVGSSLQFVMDQVIKVKGGNMYDLPHMGKDKLLNENGSIPFRLPCTDPTLQPFRDAAVFFEADEQEQETGHENNMDNNNSNDSNITIDNENKTADDVELTTMMEYLRKRKLSGAT